MPHCPEHAAVALLPMKKGWFCEECDHTVLTYAEHPRDDGASQARVAPPVAAPPGVEAARAAALSDLDALPFPVAPCVAG